jgi:hypothetical protein
MGDTSQPPMTGSIPIAIGMPSIVRIPIPGTAGLAVEFRPRGWVPPGGSTSTFFIQDKTGSRNLRLDFGWNQKTKTVDYHWNQEGVAKDLKVTNHTPVGRVGAVMYHAARYFRWAGRILVVTGAMIDAVSIVQASKPIKRATEVATAWALARVGCSVGGRVGALAGAEGGLPGIAVGAVAGCIIGTYSGYKGGTQAGAAVYQWAEDTYFTKLPEAKAP